MATVVIVFISLKNFCTSWFFYTFLSDVIRYFDFVVAPPSASENFIFPIFIKQLLLFFFLICCFVNGTYTFLLLFFICCFYTQKNKEILYDFLSTKKKNVFLSFWGFHCLIYFCFVCFFNEKKNSNNSYQNLK